MTALVVHLEPVVDDVLLAHLDVVRERVPSTDSPHPPSFKQQLGVDQVAFVLEQPLNAVERAAAFFVRR